MSSLKRALLMLIVIGVSGAGYFLWALTHTYEQTDDAQIDGDIYPIASRVAGKIKAVYISTNQQVKAGQLLVELDPSDYDTAVRQAVAAINESRAAVAAARPNVPITTVQTDAEVSTRRSEVAAARAQVEAAQRDSESAAASVRQTEADNAKAQADLARYKVLVSKDEVSHSEYDRVEATAKSLAATVDSRAASAAALSRRVEVARSRERQAEELEVEAERNRPFQIAIEEAGVVAGEADTATKKPALDQALLNLSYTKIAAPVSGIIAANVGEPGQHVARGQQLMVVVPIDNLWVTANFKETQLKTMRPGQRATIHVKALDIDYDGYVESIGAATGARFSLLPAESQTSNYVKVVQRLPVRIRFKTGEDEKRLLRPGMSAEPRIWIKH